MCEGRAVGSAGKGRLGQAGAGDGGSRWWLVQGATARVAGWVLRLARCLSKESHSTAKLVDGRGGMPGCKPRGQNCRRAPGGGNARRRGEAAVPVSAPARQRPQHGLPGALVALHTYVERCMSGKACRGRGDGLHAATPLRDGRRSGTLTFGTASRSPLLPSLRPSRVTRRHAAPLPRLPAAPAAW